MAFRAFVTNSWMSKMGVGVSAAASGSRAKSGLELKGQCCAGVCDAGDGGSGLDDRNPYRQAAARALSRRLREQKETGIVPEVEDPDPVISSADKLIKSRFFEKSPTFNTLRRINTIPSALILSLGRVTRKRSRLPE